MGNMDHSDFLGVISGPFGFKDGIPSKRNSEDLPGSWRSFDDMP